MSAWMHVYAPIFILVTVAAFGFTVACLSDWEDRKFDAKGFLWFQCAFLLMLFAGSCAVAFQMAGDRLG